MSETLKTCRVIILVKAFPQPSVAHGETVCCAGITESGEFKRLFPIRYRNLGKDSAFNRWDWVSFEYQKPPRDSRRESCRVIEERIRIDGCLSERNRSMFLNRYVSTSVHSAAESGKSLALIRPRETKFIIKEKKIADLKKEEEKYKNAVKQMSLLDKDLKAIKPVPYEFRFEFHDGSGPHDYKANDWETSAMFNRAAKREGSDEKALEWMERIFNKDYPEKSMLFCVGNIAKYPKTWQLLGVLRVDDVDQDELF